MRLCSRTQIPAVPAAGIFYSIGILINSDSNLLSPSFKLNANFTSIFSIDFMLFFSSSEL